jgi:hypothetical protein
MNIFLFTGAGCSVELGVPAMRSMAEQFLEHLNENVSTSPLLVQVAKRLASEDYDMEHLVEELDSISTGLSTGSTWELVGSVNPTLDVEVLRQEAEWFILHVCERILPGHAKRLWGPTLRATATHDVTIGTTNYDRAIEVAASGVGIAVADGFAAFQGREYAEWLGFGTPMSLRVLKLHGSTDWYHTPGTAAVTKLRHPMPLFGQLTVSLNVLSSPQLGNAAVLPSREKKITQAPYPELTYELQAAARQADVAVFLGSSLRDPDIRGLCDLCALRSPTFVVSPKPSFAAGVLPSSANVIPQSASRFLMATLPAFLSSGDVSILLDSSRSDAAPANVLALIIAANDEDRPLPERCHAIEAIATSGVMLPERDIDELLNDPASSVRLFSLALIQGSKDAGQLLQRAKQIGERESDSEFSAEVTLLEELLK